MAQAGHDVEKVVLARALKLVFEDRVCVSGNRPIETSVGRRHRRYRTPAG